MVEEFVLFEDSETIDREYSWGEVSSTEVGYRLVVLIKDDNVTIEYQSGTIEGQERNIEWLECDPFDIHPRDLDACEIDRLGTLVYDLKLASILNR